VNKPVCAVIGGSGFLGRETVPELSRAFQVVPTSMQKRGGPYRTLDSRDPSALKAFLTDLKPDLVVVLAAYREPDFCEEHPEEARRLNTQPISVMCDTLPACVPLLFVSTDYVFDGEHPPYREDSPRNPVSVYGQSKKEAEDFTLSRPGSMVMRVPLLMGWMDHPEQSGYFSHLISDLKKNEPIALDHVLKRYPVWTRDAGVFMRYALENQLEGVIHFSTTRALTRYDAAREMGELLGWPTTHLTPSDQVIPRKAKRPRDARMSIDRLKSIGYPEPRDFKDVALSFLDHFGMVPPIM